MFGRFAFWTGFQPQKWFTKTHSPDLLSYGEEPPNHLRRFVIGVVSVALFTACVIFPSGKISMFIQKPFAFEVPKTIPAGDVLTFPTSGDYQSVRVGHSEPMALADKGLYFFGFNLPVKSQAPAETEIYALYKPARHLGLTRLIRSEPIYFSTTTFTVTPAAQVSAVHASNSRMPASITPRRMSATAQAEDIAHRAQDDLKLSQLITRNDGSPQVNCWSEPLLNPTPGTALRAHGPGETVMAEETAAQGKTVVIYHGGGIFTRYMNLREFQTHVGEKVGSGQLVGFAGSPGRRENPKFWEVSWNDKILNPTDFVEFSQKFCDSKAKKAIARNALAAERSPAMKLFQKMRRHQQHD